MGSEFIFRLRIFGFRKNSVVVHHGRSGAPTACFNGAGGRRGGARAKTAQFDASQELEGQGCGAGGGEKRTRRGRPVCRVQVGSWGGRWGRSPVRPSSPGSPAVCLVGRWRSSASLIGYFYSRRWWIVFQVSRILKRGRGGIQSLVIPGRRPPELRVRWSLSSKATRQVPGDASHSHLSHAIAGLRSAMY